MKPTTAGWADRRGWLESELVVIGRIDRVHVLDEVGIAETEWPIEAQLERVDIDLEAVLKGRHPGDSLRFYRYGLLRGQVPGNVPVTSLLPGERRIFFLEREGKALRAKVDLVSSSFEVISGKHRLGDTPRIGLEYSIAEVLVLPGEEVNEEAYLKGLPVQSGLVVPLLIGLQGTTELLREVMKYPNRAIAVEACLALYRLSPFGDECVRTVPLETSLSAATRERAGDIVRTYRQRVEIETRQFREQPAAWYRERIEVGDILSVPSPFRDRDARFLLTELSGHSDELVRKNARMLVQAKLVDAEGAAVKFPGEKR